MANPPPKKPGTTTSPGMRKVTVPPPPGSALRRRLSTDEFQVVKMPPLELEGDTAASELGKAEAGIMKRLTGLGKVPEEVHWEIAALIKGTMPHPYWHELLRVLLAPPPPATPAEMEGDAKRIVDALQLPLGRLTRSRTTMLDRIRGLGVSACHFYRGADIVVGGGARLYDEFVPLAAAEPAAAQPFPQTRRIDIPTLGTLLFGRPQADETLLRFSGHVTELRRAAPTLMEYFERLVVKDQNIGPMGISARTLKANNPVRVRFHA